MTGKYIDFKGKLKAGDRVRECEIDGYVWKVLKVFDSGLDLECEVEIVGHTVSKFVSWQNEGVIELLSPSPRVVTRDDLRFGTIVRLKNGLILQWIGQVDIRSNQDFLWRTIWSPFATTAWVNKNPDEMDFAIVPKTLAFLPHSEPVQPASPPAPAEKEEDQWWEEDRYWMHTTAGSSDMTPMLERIVAEAKRRGAEEAWKEAEERLLQDLEAVNSLEKMSPGMHKKSEYRDGLFQAYRLIKSKRCQNLTKPVTPGEK